jgi:hypothetical protein
MINNKKRKAKTEGIFIEYTQSFIHYNYIFTLPKKKTNSINVGVL